MNDLRRIIKKPLVTERSTLEREQSNVVTFAVDLHANKLEIKRAVEELFSVKVEEVRTLRVKGKTRRVGKNFGFRPSWKKARVRLRAGDTINFFEGV